MSEYNIKLCSQNGQSCLELKLNPMSSTEAIDDFTASVEAQYVYNDYAYSIKAFDETGNSVIIQNASINYEPIDKKYLSGNYYGIMFIECFGVIRIEIVIDEIAYITDNINVKMKKENINQSIENMIDYIYNNCDDYLYEEHKYSKISSGIDTNANVSIETKLSLLDEIYKCYLQCYQILRHSSHSRLENADSIGDFSKMNKVGPTTIKYITTHPEELQPVSYNSGISINKQYYQPNNTLISSVKYSRDTYENRNIVGFLKTVFTELRHMKKTIEIAINRHSNTSDEEGYVDSSYYIYTRNTKLLKGYICSIDEMVLKFQKLFCEYKSILPVSDCVVISCPKYTNVFRTIMPYNMIFSVIQKWFNSGDFDLAKSDFLLSFVSISKIYEYFCLIKINKAWEGKGFCSISKKPFKYAENYYYVNTTYNNTFVFSKEEINVTVYFQPIIYGKNKTDNGINLIRNTSISAVNPDDTSIIDDFYDRKRKYYTPDYLIKVERGTQIYYYILDAKHSRISDIIKNKLPILVFKYLFSISPKYANERLLGLSIVCGKEESNSFSNIYNNAENMGISILPHANIMGVAGLAVEDNEPLYKLIDQILSDISGTDISYSL